MSTDLSAKVSTKVSSAADEPVVGVERHNERVPLLPSYESPLVGRATELAQLRSRTFDSDAGTSNLVGGDAGVGKTRLITTLMHETVEAGARVLLGHCLDLGDSSAPYLPFAEMFARLAQEEHELVLELVRDRPLLAPLLPEYYRREVRTDLPTDRGSFFDAVHMSLEQLGEQSPVVVVVEDAHWADRSTRELLTFLFTRGFGSHVSLVVSFRSDDLNRRHPLRSKLAWLQRARADHARFARGGRGPVPAELLSDWRETLDTFVEHGEPYETARAQLTHAALLAAAGDRDAARALQDQARATARRIGATVLVADSRRAPATASTGLTPREQEVLALVTDGRTNGEIAKELFISTKTASVHVSNILAKLRAATRTEAAAIARRDELV